MKKVLASLALLCTDLQALDIFDFSLSPEDMHRINDLECGHRFASY